jgi:NAD-dependent SIR2 family protein deacetylase
LEQLENKYYVQTSGSFNYARCGKCDEVFKEDAITST